MQHTRRLTRVQHTKYYSHASYNHPAHEDGSRAAHKIELVCSTRKITLVSHASSVRVTRQKYKNTCVLPHASVNLEMSCTITHAKHQKLACARTVAHDFGMRTWESKHTQHMRDTRHELTLGLPHYTCGVTTGAVAVSNEIQLLCS